MHLIPFAFTQQPTIIMMLLTLGLNTYLLQGIWIFTWPKLRVCHVLSYTPDGCNSEFHWQFVSVTDVWTFVWNYECLRKQCPSHPGWLEPWMNISLDVFNGKFPVIPLYLCFVLSFKTKCLSSVTLFTFTVWKSMHKFTCCSNLKNVVTNVHCV